MKTRLLLSLFALLAATALACGGDSDSSTPALAGTSPTPTATSTPLPTDTPTDTPRPGASEAPQGLESGDPPIDAILEAVEAGDVEKLASFFELQDVACTSATGLGGPPKCSDFSGNPSDGTTVQALPAGGCEGYWVNDLEAAASTFLDLSPTLFAVIKLEQPKVASFDGYVPLADAAMIFEHEQSGKRRFGYMWLLSGGRIVALSGGCGTGPEIWLDGPASFEDYRVILRGPAY